LEESTEKPSGEDLWFLYLHKQTPIRGNTPQTFQHSLPRIFSSR